MTDISDPHFAERVRESFDRQNVMHLIRATLPVIEHGRVLSGNRKQANGTVLTWQLTDLRCVIADGIVPFFIDWGKSPHPALVASGGATLVNLRAEHPDADRVLRMLGVIAVDLKVGVGAAPALIAGIDCPNGRVLLG